MNAIAGQLVAVRSAGATNGPARKVHWRCPWRWPVGGLIALLSSLPAAAQSPPTGIDDAVIRVNTLRAVNQEVLPCLASEMNEIVIDGGTLFDETFTINQLLIRLGFADVEQALRGMGFQNLGSFRLHVRTGNTIIRLPVDDQAVAAAFAGNGAPDTGSVICPVDLPDASLRSFIGFEGTVSSNFLDWLPREFLNLLTVSETVFLSVTGANLQVNAALARVDEQLEVTVGGLTASVDQVSISDSGPVTEIANLVGVGVCTLLGQPGGNCSVNTAATKLANELLRWGNHERVRTMLSAALTKALEGQAEFGAAYSVPAMNGFTLQCDVSLGGFATQPNRLTTTWPLSIGRLGGGFFPNLTYTYAARPAQNPATEPAEGDVQVWVPLSLFDKITFEMMKTGLGAQSFPIPQTQFTYAGKAFLIPAMSVRLESPSVPRAIGDNGAIVTSFTTRIGGEAGNVSFAVSAAVTVKSSIVIAEDQLSLRVDSADMKLTGGCVNIGGVKIPLTALPEGLRQAVAAGFQWLRPGSKTKIGSRVVEFDRCASIQLDSVAIGQRYVRAALTASAN